MSNAYRRETRESGTMRFRVEWFFDADTDAPWDREDGHGPVSDWTPEAVFIHWEGEPLICAHSGREIPSAYGEVEE